MQYAIAIGSNCTNLSFTRQSRNICKVRWRILVMCVQTEFFQESDSERILEISLHLSKL